MDIAGYLLQKTDLDIHPEGSRGEWRGSCPFHSGGTGGKNFGINSTTGQWICRSAGCGKKGSFPLFYKLLEGIKSWAEVRKRLGQDMPLQDWDAFLGLLQKGEKAAGISFQEMPSEHFQREVTEADFPDYLRIRGYDERLCGLGFGLRYAFAGEYRGRLLMPFFDLEGRLLTFTARAMSEDEPTRYRFPEGASSGHFLYGVHRLATATPSALWVVEGQFDVIRLAWLGEYAVGLSTAKMSARQSIDIRRLFKTLQVPVLVCLDRGTYANTTTIWADLRAMGVDARRVDVSPFAKDPGLLTHEGMSALKFSAQESVM